MDNNDVLRRLRYIFDLGDSKVIEVFGLGGEEFTRAQISDWLKKEEDESFKKCNDKTLAVFLNGFITLHRGQKQGVEQKPETELTNNLILWKLRIALNLRSDDVMKVMQQADFPISEHEISALFRKPGHKHYRECKDQFLRNFLLGLQKKHRNN